MPLVRNDIVRRLESAETKFGPLPQPVRIIFEEYEGQTDDELRIKHGWPPETPLIVVRVVDASLPSRRWETVPSENHPDQQEVHA